MCTMTHISQVKCVYFCLISSSRRILFVCAFFKYLLQMEAARARSDLHEHVRGIMTIAGDKLEEGKAPMSSVNTEDVHRRAWFYKPY